MILQPKPRGRPRKNSWWHPTRGWVRYSAQVLYDRANTEQRTLNGTAYASRVALLEEQEKRERLQEEQRKEQSRLDDQAAIAAAAKAAEDRERAEAEEKRCAKEWKENEARRYAKSIKEGERLTCPVYYMANDGLMYSTDETPRKRKGAEPFTQQRVKKWRLLEEKVYGPTDDGLCKGEWEFRDVWVFA